MAQVTNIGNHIINDRWFFSNRLLSTRSLVLDRWVIESSVDCDVMSTACNLTSRPMNENGEEKPTSVNHTSSYERCLSHPEEGSTLSNIRLSFVGFQRERTPSTLVPGTDPNAVAENATNVDVFDEIHSTRFSSVLEETKSQLMDNLPILTEEMISCAIVHAFSDNIEHPDRRGKSLDVPRRCLKKAEAWVKDRQGSFDKEQAIQFLRGSLRRIFLCIRDNDLSAQQAVQIVLHIAEMLGLREEDNLIEDQDHPPGSPEISSLVCVNEQADSPRCVMKHISYHEYREKIMKLGKRTESHKETTLCRIFLADFKDIFRADLRNFQK